MKASKIAIVTAALLLVGGGCFGSTSTTTSVQTPPPTPAPVAQSQTFMAAGLKFTLPKSDWKVESNDGSRIVINTASSSPYNVRLRLGISKASSRTDWDAPTELFSAGDLRLSSVFCGGAGEGGGCYGLETASGAYSINWYVDSNQQGPGTDAGSWSPDKNFTKADIEAMLKTAVEVK